MSRVDVMFASDEHEVRALLREANELRRARGLQQLGPWWRVAPGDLHHPRRRAKQRGGILRFPHRRATATP